MMNTYSWVWTFLSVSRETNENDIVEEEESGVTTMLPFVGDCGARRLASALSSNHLLLYLNLSNNRIGVQGGGQGDSKILV